MSDPNSMQEEKHKSMSSIGSIECSDRVPRGADARASAGPCPPVAPSGRRGTRAPIHEGVRTLCAVEEKLDAARRENASLKDRNRQLMLELADARQRGSEARHLARHDPLTGLPNRLLLRERLQDGIAAARRSQRSLALLFIDLDHFKRVNDRLGHAAGDKLLVIVASRILGGIRADDIAFRYGGDEFVVLLSNIGDVETVGPIADKVRRRIGGRYGIDDKEVSISASIGIAAYPLHGDHCDALIRHADASMYRCKATSAADCGIESDTVVIGPVGKSARAAGESVRDAGESVRHHHAAAVATARLLAR
jgi:diguanylate cyclase (GGDEF)-like protein